MVARPSMDKLSILAVDESAALRSLITGALNDGPFEVIGAPSTGDALTLLQQATPGSRFALVLCPADMDFVRQLRSAPGYAATPVVIITDATDSALKAAAKELNVAGWINTPFDPRQLLDVVLRHAGH